MSLDNWLARYAESHQNPRNKLLHQICVPIIFFSSVALLWKLSFFLFVVAAAGVLFFYYTLGKNEAICGALMIGASVLLQMILGFGWLALLAMLGLAWAGQFYGHQLEGKKPSFLEDLKFLLIGPLWVFAPLLRKYKLL